ALGMLRSAIKNYEIDKMKTLEDSDVLDVVGKQVKQLRDGLDSFVAGGREDLAEGVRAELAVVEGYLPAQLTDDELNAIVAKVVAGAGEVTEKDFGRIMKEVSKETAGKANGQRVSAAVKAALAGK